MYFLKEETKEIIKKYKLKEISETIGINYRNLSKMIKNNKKCKKMVAYSLTMYIDSTKKIEYFFEKEQNNSEK